MITTFTPVASLFGGALIGLAAVLLMLMLGRIMGATGILTGLFAPQSGQDWAWRAAVLLGMVSGPAAYLMLTGEFPAVELPVSIPVM